MLRSERARCPEWSLRRRSRRYLVRVRVRVRVWVKVRVRVVEAGGTDHGQPAVLELGEQRDLALPLRLCVLRLAARDPRQPRLEDGQLAHLMVSEIERG